MNSSPAASPLAPGALSTGAKSNQPLLDEVSTFRSDCARRYAFNNRWDVVLSTVGILLSVAVVAAGFLKRPEISAILGAMVGAVVTSQKAFPFGQRARFYRLLIGQADNLTTFLGQGLWSPQQAVVVLATLRMDFAQELPRGTSTAQETDSIPPKQGAAAADTNTPQTGNMPQTGNTPEPPPAAVDPPSSPLPADPDPQETARVSAPSLNR